MSKRIQFISEKSEHLLALLKNDNHAQNSLYTLGFLVVLLLLTASIHFIKFGLVGITIIGLILLLLLMIVFRIQMQTSIRDNAAAANYESFKSVDESTYLRSKLQYLFTGIDIKYTRTKAIRLMYVLIFPIIMVLSKEIFLGSFGFSSSLKYFIFALMTGGVFWWFFFNSDIEDLEISKDDIKDYLEEL